MLRNMNCASYLLFKSASVLYVHICLKNGFLKHKKCAFFWTFILVKATEYKLFFRIFVFSPIHTERKVRERLAKRNNINVNFTES